MDTEFVRVYRELFERHWWWRARRAVVLREVRRLAPEAGFGRVLDVGCGDGLFFDDLAAFGDVQGVEPDEAAVSPDGPHRARIHVGAFGPDTPLDGPFGLVLMLDVLEHLGDPVGALARAREVLAPNGRVLVTVPAFQALWTDHDRISHHLRRYRRASLSADVVAAGLSCARSRYLFHGLAAIKLLVRAKERLVSTRARPPRVPAGNRAWFALARTEESLLAPLRLPFGSSLLAVLRRTPGAPGPPAGGIG